MLIFIYYFLWLTIFGLKGHNNPILWEIKLVAPFYIRLYFIYNENVKKINFFLDYHNIIVNSNKNFKIKLADASVLKII